MKPAKTNKKIRKYIPENDLRRFSDGIRLHPYLGCALRLGWDDLLSRYPNCNKTHADFSRSAIPVLQRIGTIALVDPLIDVPKWLDAREAKLVLRGKKRPIWMTTPTFPSMFKIWDHIVAEMRGEEIIWLKVGLPHSRH